ncbi:condensation domain-containing protein [Vibrio sp. PP-XX7]
MGVFVKELSTLYRVFSLGQSNPLPALPCSFGDFAAWQHAHVNGERLLAQQAYWREQLKGAPDCLLLPTDRPRPESQDYAGAMVPVRLDRALTHGLRILGQRHGATLFMTLLTSWSMLMARLSNQDDVVIGTPFAGRTQTAVEDLIGMFVNTQAQRVDLSGQPTTESLLQQVKATTLAAQVNQDVPFDQVVEAVSPTRSLSYTPIFQVLFALQNTPEMAFELPGLTLSPLETELTTAQFDLSLSLNEAGDPSRRISELCHGVV